jgi:hypothetical protein
MMKNALLATLALPALIVVAGCNQTANRQPIIEQPIVSQPLPEQPDAVGSAPAPNGGLAGEPLAGPDEDVPLNCTPEAIADGAECRAPGGAVTVRPRRSGGFVDQAEARRVLAQNDERAGIVSDNDGLEDDTLSPPAAGAARRPSLVSDDGLALPNGGNCAADNNRFRSLIRNDLQMGHTTKGVHDEIIARIARLDQQCASGRDTRPQLVDLRQQFGYPVN